MNIFKYVAISHNVTNITQYAIKFAVCTCKFVQLRMISQFSRQLEVSVATDSSLPGHIHCLCCSLAPVFEYQWAQVLILLVAVFETFQSFSRPIRCQCIIAIPDPCKCNPVQPLRPFRLLQVE